MDLKQIQLKSRIRRWVGLAVKVFLAVAVVALIVVLDLPFPKPRLTVLYAFGQAGGCSFSAAIHSSEVKPRLEQVRDAIAARSRIIQADPAGFELAETPRGQYWTPQGNAGTTPMLAEQEVGLYGNGEEGVHPGDVVLDCGAAIGDFTRTALTAGAKKVVAIEIAPVLVECLRRTFAEEIAAGRVVVYPKGVWHRDDWLELAGDSVVFGGAKGQKIRVPVTTIDAIVSEANLERVDFIKMDIEGSEKAALRGAAGTLRRFRPRMAISSEHMADDHTAIPRLVAELWPGYTLRRASCWDQGLRVRPAVLMFR